MSAITPIVFLMFLFAACVVTGLAVCIYADRRADGVPCGRCNQKGRGLFLIGRRTVICGLLGLGGLGGHAAWQWGSKG